MTNLIQSPFTGKDQETFLQVCANLDQLNDLCGKDADKEVLNTISLFSFQFTKSLSGAPTGGESHESIPFHLLEKIFNAFKDYDNVQNHILKLLVNESFGDTVRERCIYIRMVIFDLFDRIFSRSIDNNGNGDFAGLIRLQKEIWNLTHIFDVACYSAIMEGVEYESVN
jgi:hypothetical protein